MKVLNLRKGFATNSSSSHSIVVLKKGVKLTDAVVDGITTGDFGWESFTCATEEAKRVYAASQLATFLNREFEYEYDGQETQSMKAAFDRIEKLCGVRPIPGCSVDHQSTWALARLWDGTSFDEGFFKDMLKHVLRNDIAILGGHDNDYEGHPDNHGSNIEKSADPIPNESHHWVARQEGDYWVMFNRRDGSKIRLTFNDAAPPYVKGAFPELVDVKITDYCNYGCAYCYQDSTREGQHASMVNLTAIANALADAHIFEVAIGGGEPTQHPQWPAIIQMFVDRHIKPNFTTRNFEWLANPANFDIIKKCGGVAFSVDNVKLIDQIGGWLKEYHHTVDHYDLDVCIQYVIGVADDTMLEDLMKKCAENNLRLTLLGFKDVGRGDQFLKIGGLATNAQETTWFDGVYKKLNAEYEKAVKDWQAVYDTWKRKHSAVGAAPEYPRTLIPNISIDTALAQKCKDLIVKEGVSKRAFHVVEGAFSMYIDAVKFLIGPSSYCPPNQLTPLRLNTMWDVFRSFPGEEVVE